MRQRSFCEITRDIADAMRQGSRRSGMECITPPSEEMRPPSNAAVTFLPSTAGNENSGFVSSVMAAVVGADQHEKLVLILDDVAHQNEMMSPTGTE